MCNHIVQHTDKNIHLILHFEASGTGVLSGIKPLSGPAGLSSISSTVAGTMSDPHQTCWASPPDSKAFLPPPVWLTSSNGLALSSYFQVKLLMAEQYTVLLQPALWFKYLLSLLSNRDKNFVPCPFILLCKSTFSNMLSHTVQLATLHPLLHSVHLFKPLKFWSPKHEIFSVSFSQCYTQVK